MNHHKCILLIVLFIIVPLTSGLAGELIIYSSEGVETLSLPDSQPSDRSPDNYRKISERCIRNCDEITAPPKPAAKSSTKREGEGFVIPITEEQSESQSQWQIPVFRSERRERRREPDIYVYPAPPSIPSGAIDTRTGEFYPGAAGGIINPRTGEFMPDVGGGYIDPKTGRFIPKQ